MKSQLEGLWAPSLRNRMSIDRVHHAAKGSPSSRFIITLDDKIIWDWPMNFFMTYSVDANGVHHSHSPRRGEGLEKFYGTNPRDIERSLRFYLDTPRDKLMEPFISVREIRTYPYHSLASPPTIRETDMNKWDICDLMRAADRRIGYLRLSWWSMFEMDGGNPARRVLGARFENRKKVRNAA